MASEFSWSPLEEMVKCSFCFEMFEDHEVVQRSNIRGRRQYACFACMKEMEPAQPEEVEGSLETVFDAACAWTPEAVA